jgi:hypothetical protein
MKEYTMIDIDKEYDSFEPDRESLTYFANHKDEFVFNKLVELTNKNIELEERVKIQENRSFTGYRGNK